MEAAHLTELLDEDAVALSSVARLEILIGANKANEPSIRRGLSAIPTYRPVGTSWDRLEGWVSAASTAGQRFGVADLLVAAIAADHEAELWSLDADFERMATLGFVRLHRW